MKKWTRYDIKTIVDSNEHLDGGEMLELYIKTININIVPNYNNKKLKN